MDTTPVYITNAFSLSMIPSDRTANIEVRPISVGTVTWYAKYMESIVGHADTAALFSNILGIHIPVNRVSVIFDQPRTILLVGQYVGPRLPEGTTTLPEGARIDWKLVTVDIT